MPTEDPSSSPSPKATPPSSSSPQSPPGLPPEPQPSAETPAASTDAPASKSTRKKTTTRRKSTRSRAGSSRRKVGVESEKPEPKTRVAAGNGNPIEKVAAVTPELVKAKLKYAGDITHGLGVSYFGLDSVEAKKYLQPEMTRDLFRFTNDELEAIAPAVANMANRHALARRMVEQSDEGVIALVVARSAVRNFTDLRAAAALLEVYAPTPPEGGDDDGRLETEVEAVPRGSRAGTGAGAPGGSEAGG